MIPPSPTTHPALDEVFSRGLRLHQSGQVAEALQCYLELLAIKPTDTRLLLNTAAALHDLERYHEALALYDRALEIGPASGMLHHNRGNTLLALDLLPEAVASYRRAADLLPASAEPLVPMGTALERLGRYQDAMEHYREALQRDPACAEAHWNMALLHLLVGNYEEGWQEFEWRWRKKRYPTPPRHFSCPEWCGELFRGKTILIHAEQGLGDTIQFGRYISLVAERGGHIVLEVPGALTGLFQQIPGIQEIVRTGGPLPVFDLHVPLLSLPRIFGTTLANLPRSTPYLSVPRQYDNKWDLILPRHGGMKVGIVWKGRKIPDPARSCPAEYLASLAGLTNIQFYSLQISEDAQPVAKPDGVPLIDLTAWIRDFSDTAALIHRLDLVISIDTSVAHLAGGLGCPTWVLLPFAADWRWLLNRTDSPWYPTVRLFRQQEPGGWQEVLNRVREQLLQLHPTASIEKPGHLMTADNNVEAYAPHIFSYSADKDYYLGPLHDTGGVPLPQAGSNSYGNGAEEADFYILHKDLIRLHNHLGIDGVRRFIQELPYYRRSPERHMFWSSHDDPLSPDESAIFCKTSVSLLERGHHIAVPYLVEDLAEYTHFTFASIRWHTCFVGYPGSSGVREQLILSVAGCKRITSRIDIAPKFHSHLDAETKQKRRRIYLETVTQSLTVLCPRGDGMSSIRFFETLSLGRIPVLISDWCALPFDSLIAYDRFVIRIAEGDVNRAGEIIGNWIAEKNHEELMERCREARRAWEQFLSPAGTEHCLRMFLQVLNAADAARFPAEPGKRPPASASPGETNSHLIAGLQQYDKGDTETAERCFRQAMAEEGREGEATACLALLLNEQGRYGETINLLTQGQGSPPAKPQFTRLLGEAYQAADMADKAYEQYCRVMPAIADDPLLLMNLGVVCDSLDRQQEALTHLTRAMELAPENPQILLNLGGVLQAMNMPDDAEECYRKALRLDPGYATAAWNLAQVLLLKGDYQEGFQYFEARFSKRDPVPQSGLVLPLWNGEPIGNRTIVVATEQAFGDALQFCRYVPLLSELGAKVIIFNHLPSLHTLFESLPGVSGVVSDPHHLPHADFQISMLSLPRLFRTTIENVPARVPYLQPPPGKVMAWGEKLPPATGMRIGLVWAGRRMPDPRRSADLSDFAPLGKIPGVRLISLQMGPGSEATLLPPAGMTILDKTADIKDFEDTAALIANLDLVITVDTSVAHLAGAMGKPIWLLLPFAPDWRWLLGRSDSPWYPTMRIFRQETRGNWGTVISRVVASLPGR